MRIFYYNTNIIRTCNFFGDMAAFSDGSQHILRDFWRVLAGFRSYFLLYSKLQILEDL